MTNSRPTTTNFADTLMAARIADHLAHCTGCRERTEATQARQAEHGESIRRRDRRQLSLTFDATT